MSREGENIKKNQLEILKLKYTIYEKNSLNEPNRLGLGRLWVNLKIEQCNLSNLKNRFKKLLMNKAEMAIVIYELDNKATSITRHRDIL